MHKRVSKRVNWKYWTTVQIKFCCIKQFEQEKFRKTEINDQDPAYLKVRLIDFFKKKHFFYITKLKDRTCRILLSHKFQRRRIILYFILPQSDFVGVFWFFFLKICNGQDQMSMIELTMFAIFFLMNKLINTSIIFPFNYAGFPQRICVICRCPLCISPPSSIRKLYGVTLNLQTKSLLFFMMIWSDQIVV